MTLHRDINLLMSSFMIRQTGAAFLSGHYGYAVCGLQHFMFFLFGYKQCFHLKNIMNNVRHNFLPFLSGVICWKPVGCWWQTLRVKLNLLFAKCLWQENIQNKHSSHISITMGSENKEEKVWLVVEMRHLDGLPVNVCLSVCRRGGGVRVCCHFLLESLLYVWPLAWTPVRSFLMISFTAREIKTPISDTDAISFTKKFPNDKKTMPSWPRKTVTLITFLLEIFLSENIYSLTDILWRASMEGRQMLHLYRVTSRGSKQLLVVAQPITSVCKHTPTAEEGGWNGNFHGVTALKIGALCVWGGIQLAFEIIINTHIIGAVVYLSQQHRFEFMEFCFYLLSKTAK